MYDVGLQLSGEATSPSRSTTCSGSTTAKIHRRTKPTVTAEGFVVWGFLPQLLLPATD